jgi:PEP-CTERM motif
MGWLYRFFGNAGLKKEAVIMKKFIIILATVLIVPLILVHYSHAELIGYSQGGMGYATSIGSILSSVDISPWYSHNDLSDPIYRPFGTITIGSAFVGDIWTADSASLDFANAVSLLTNGVYDMVGGDNLTFGGSSAVGEAYALQGPGFTDPDFQGSMINRMTLQLDSYSSQYVPDFPWGFDETETGPAFVTMYDYTIDYEYIEEQKPIPEPTTMLLLGIGLMIIGLVSTRTFKN